MRDEGTRDEGRGMRDGKTVGERINSFRDLRVYKIAFEAAMGIFEVTKEFPKEEKYSLTDQVRRSSRSVCSNIAEAWRKRKYIAVFVNKLSDAGMEASETQTWLEFALRCGYIDKAVFGSLNGKYEHIFAMLNTMGNKAGSFCGPAGKIVRRPSERSERSSIVRR